MAQFLVTSTADSGDNANAGTGTLRAAIIYANEHPGTTINFDHGISGQTITLKSELPLILGDNTVIDGGAEDITVSGNQFRPFFIGDANQLAGQAMTHATIENLTIADSQAFGGSGASGGAGLGGAVFVSSNGALTLTNVSLTHNFATGGSGNGDDYFLSGGGMGGLGFTGGGGFGNSAIGGGEPLDFKGGGQAGAGELVGSAGAFTGGTPATSGDPGGTGSLPPDNNNSPPQYPGGQFGGGGGADQQLLRGQLPAFAQDAIQDGKGAGGSIGGGGGVGGEDANGAGDHRAADGGFGGGGAGGVPVGGTGGFGGGGGAGITVSKGGGGGGSGGFGGGGGPGLPVTQNLAGSVGGGAGGFGGGDGWGASNALLLAGQIYGAGGGGAAMGGAVFVMGGGSLTFGGTLDLNNNSVLGGDSHGFSIDPISGEVKADSHFDGQPGRGLGSGLFLNGSGTLAFQPGAGQTQKVADAIADQNGEGGASESNGVGGLGGSWSLTKSGDGTLILQAGNNTYTGATTVSAGLLLVDGSIANSAVTVKSGGSLGGHGTTGAVLVQSGGTLAPGDSPGVLHTNNVTLSAGAHFAVQLGGTAAGEFDQVDVTGGVFLFGPTLDLSLFNGFHPASGNSFIIIDNDGVDAVGGTFDGLAEGARFTTGNQTFQITYAGGTGNDVVLTTLSSGPVVTGVTSTTANGAYKAGDVISIQVSFDGLVTVDTSGGTPQLTLETGAVDRVINYSSGTGTNTLTFTYTVQAGDTSADLDTLSTTALALNGGTIRDANSLDATLTLPAPGAANSLGANQAIVIDTTAPATPLAPTLTNDTGTAGDNKTSDPAITYPAPAAGDVLLYRLDGGSFSTSKPTIATDGSADGQHTVTIEERDAAGNISGTSSLTFTLDTVAPPAPTAPVLANDTGTPGDGLTKDPTITYPTPAAGDVLLYKLDGGSFSTTAPIFATDGSADGPHTVTIAERDAAGNVSGTASLTFTLDTTLPPISPAPVLAHDTGTAGDNLTSDPTITYPTPVPGDVLMFSLDGGGFTTTAPTFATDGSADGQHTVSVQQRDTAGNVGAASTLTFTLDTIAPATPTAPVLANDTGTAGDNITSDPAINYPTPAAGDVLLYQLDGGSFSTTKPTIATDGSADGPHTVTIAERDTAGNVSGTASLTFTLDTVLPPIAPAPVLAHDTGTAGDKLTNDPTITYPTPVVGDVLLFSLDGGGFTTTAPTFAVDGSADGQHTVSVQERDTAGNVGAASTLTFTLDTIAPTTPAAPVLAHDTGTVGDKITSDPSITYPVAAAGDVLLFRLDGGSFSTTAPTFATDGSAHGSHTVSIVEQDAAGNVSAAASLTFTLDAAPVVGAPVTLPSVAVNSGPHLITQSALLGNVTDADGPSLTATNLQISKGLGTLVDNHDGSWTYTGAINDDTSVTFAYQVGDSIAPAVADSATLKINSAQSAPAIGSPGNDTFTAPTGNSSFTGNGGTDTIVFDFKLTDAHVSFAGNTVIIDGPTSHTVLSGISIYQFADGTVNETASSTSLVDPLFYYSQYHDVWNAHADAAQHYQVFGWHEGRNANAFFNTNGYLAHYADVKAAGVNPLDHYDQFGWKEGRDPSVNFDTKHYLAAYPDVAAAHVDPLMQFLHYGQLEGRSTFADGAWG